MTRYALDTVSREVRYAEGRAWLERMHSRTVRVLRADEAPAASRAARAEYVGLFCARFDLTPPHEWCDRWWPATAEDSGPRCAHCGADCSQGRAWNGGNMYLCSACAESVGRRLNIVVNDRSRGRTPR